jgi:MYXO-CTERM domain-containing protein
MSRYRIFSSATALLLGLAISPNAQALTIDTSDGNFGFKSKFNPGDAVYVTGECDVKDPQGNPFCCAMWVHVVPVGYPDPFHDVTKGKQNYIEGCAGAGAFYDEPIWLPLLTPGSYELTLDQYPFGGSLGSEDKRTGQLFTVSNVPAVYSVDVVAMKKAAAEGLAAAKGIANLTKLLTLIDTLSTAADWGLVFGKGGIGAALGLGIICEATETDCPTSYNSAVIIIGNKILGGIANGMALHYASIIADPPDPAFDQVVGLNFGDANALGAPWTPGADQVGPNAQIALAQAWAIQAAAYQALVPSLEKLQGAQIAVDHTGRVVQATKVMSYLQLAMNAGEASLKHIDALEQHLQKNNALSSTVEAQSTLDRIASSGFNDAERALAYSLGYDDNAMLAAQQQAQTLDTNVIPNWENLLGEARKNYNSMKAALHDLSSQAQKVKSESQPYASIQRPEATISAPANATVGATITLNASASHPNSMAQLSYAWDLDGDGQYDDGNGTMLAFTPTAPGATVVAVQVSDGTLDDIVHAVVDVAIGNAPPELLNLSPSQVAPSAEVGDTLEFHAEANDADSDPVTLTWYVDGKETGTGTDLSFSMPDEALHRIRVVAEDDDPYSPDAEATFFVRAAKWDNGSGMTTGAGGASGNASAGAGANAGSGGNGAAGSSSSDACSCTVGPRRNTWAAWWTTSMLALALWRRRRNSMPARRHSSSV